MNSVTVKIIAFFVSLFIIITVASQIYFSLNNKHKTEQAIFYTVSDSISFKGIFVRNETLIPKNSDGILNYTNPDGSKLAANSIVAQVFSDEAQIETLKKIKATTDELTLLKRVVNPGTLSAAQPEFISKQIDEKYLQVSNYIEHNNLQKANDTKSELLVLMNIYNVVTNSEDKAVISDRVNQLTSQLNSLNANYPKPLSTISTEKAGYFVSYVDGYENKLNFNSIKTLTADDINKIISEQITKDTSSVGKIFDSYSWKLVGIINSPSRLKQDTYVNLKVQSEQELIPVYIESVTPVDGNNNYKIILSCDRMNFNLVQNRVEKVSIVQNEYSGIKVPRSAINFRDDTRGVYVSLGQNVVFKKLDVVYEGDDFVLSKNTSDLNYINLNDQILFGEDGVVDSFDSDPTK